jgi:hypothetical protein
VWDTALQAAALCHWMSAVCVAAVRVPAVWSEMRMRFCVQRSSTEAAVYPPGCHGAVGIGGQLCSCRHRTAWA